MQEGEREYFMMPHSLSTALEANYLVIFLYPSILNIPNVLFLFFKYGYLCLSTYIQ